MLRCIRTFSCTSLLYFIPTKVLECKTQVYDQNWTECGCMSACFFLSTSKNSRSRFSWNMCKTIKIYTVLTYFSLVQLQHLHIHIRKISTSNFPFFSSTFLHTHTLFNIIIHIHIKSEKSVRATKPEKMYPNAAGE